MKLNHPAKRLTAALLTGAMLFSLCAPALAEGADALPDAVPGTSQPGEEGDIPLDSTHFPDENFLGCLKGLGKRLDWNSDGSLSQAERAQLTNISCGGWNIKTLQGIEYFPELTTLDCRENQITRLDLSGCPKLESLICHKNGMTTLNVRGCKALKFLTCSENDLTGIDLSQNAKLERLDCGSNPLTGFDVSQNSALTSLTCNESGLTALDVSHNPALESLQCQNNSIGSLDLSSNPKLNYLNCSYNQLESLDVSGNHELTHLYAHKNSELKELNVSSNPVLVELTCGSNKLKNLDVSANPALTRLDCGAAELTSLDVSANTALTSLACDNNGLKELDVSKNTELKILNCGYNELTSLDLSKNTALTILYCFSNELAALDLSSNTALTELHGHSNRLTALDVSKNPALTTLNCHTNQLTSLDVSNNPALTQLYCSSNEYEIELAEDGTFDLSTLPGHFDVSKAHFRGNDVTVEGTIMTVEHGFGSVTYDYDAGFTKELTFTLVFEPLEDPDPVLPELAEPAILLSQDDGAFLPIESEGLDQMNQSFKKAGLDLAIAYDKATHTYTVSGDLNSLNSPNEQASEFMLTAYADKDGNIPSLVLKDRQTASFAFEMKNGSAGFGDVTFENGLTGGLYSPDTAIIDTFTVNGGIGCDSDYPSVKFTANGDIRITGSIGSADKMSDVVILVSMNGNLTAESTGIPFYLNDSPFVGLSAPNGKVTVRTDAASLLKSGAADPTAENGPFVWVIGREFDLQTAPDGRVGNVALQPAESGAYYLVANDIDAGVDMSKGELEASGIYRLQPSEDTHHLAAHFLGEDYGWDSTDHWYICSICSAKLGATPHIVDPDTGLCDECGHDPNDYVPPLDPVGPGDASGAGAAILGVAVSGAAIWGGYEVATRVILEQLLPEGAAIPANRGELAMLIWTEKGKPEPAAQPAFTDVDDAELAKAAQWCVEQGLLSAKDGKFEPKGWMPKFKTIDIWSKAFSEQ